MSQIRPKDLITPHWIEHAECELDSVCCTDYAYWAREQIGRGDVFGFAVWDNPGTEFDGRWDGHDFLLVDGRWIVDLWSKLVAGIAEKVVFDLDSEADAADVRRIFGDRAKWSLVSQE